MYKKEIHSTLEVSECGKSPLYLHLLSLHRHTAHHTPGGKPLTGVTVTETPTSTWPGHWHATRALGRAHLSSLF